MVGSNQERPCDCAICTRQRECANHTDACNHQISGHAKWCKDVPPTRLKWCPVTSELVPDDENPAFENIVRMMEDEL